MDFGQLLFSFSGRISRKTYVIAILVFSLVGLGAMSAASALVTGDPLSPAFWDFRRENVGVWGPVYGGVMLLALWPGLALITKRLHDRNYPMWIGIAFYLGLPIATLALLWFGRVDYDAAGAPKPTQAFTLIFTLVVWPISLWFAAQSMFMRGVPGPNAYGPDPLAGQPLPGYEPRTFWNVVFNPDGRMSRKTWWLMFVALLVLFVIWSVIYGVVIYSAISGLPQASDSAWLASPEGQRAFTRVALPAIIPLMLVLYFLLWPALAAGTKRLHDRGRSGWLLALYFVPFALFAIAGSMLQESANAGAAPEGPALWLMIAAGVISAGLCLWLLVELGFLRGQPGENAYGPDPRTT
jgi:uncharacterized membrane protein YhaH (DUF805 family)